MLYDEVIRRTFDAELDDLRIRDRDLPAAHRLTECLEQFLPGRAEDIPHLERWLSFYTTAVGPDRTEQGVRLLASFANRARQHVHAWLDVLAEEGAVDRAAIPTHVITLLALVDGLCLELLTPETPLTLEQARSALAHVVSTSVIAGHAPR